MVSCAHDYTGKKFGKVTVIGRAEDHIQPSGRRRVMWECVCECGREFVHRDDGLAGITSCGCQRNKENAIRLTKHSESRTRLYNIYYSMVGRCHNPRSAEYGRYGGRGISVCAEWRNDNTKFFEWAVASGYNAEDHELSLERIDVDGNYCPENCKWIRLADQYNNRRSTIRVGNLTLKQFCEQAGLDYNSVRGKYYRTKDIVYALGFASRSQKDE